MDCETFGDVTVLGNFAPLLTEKPEPFDYEKTCKWLEPYPFDVRERIGRVVCSCTHLEAHYAPYYGWDYYHLKSCNLMKQLRARPQLLNLWQYQTLPAVYPAGGVPAGDPVPLFIDCHASRARRVPVQVKPPQQALPLLEGIL